MARDEWIDDFTKFHKRINIRPYVYNQQDRVPNLFLSLTSWAGVVFFTIKKAIPDDMDKRPANW